MTKIYCVSLGAQKDEITKYCFDECGKVLFGTVEIEGGTFLLCREGICPYLEQSLELDNGVVVRKLTPLVEAVKEA